jgi:hypothetical protein
MFLRRNIDLNSSCQTFSSETQYRMKYRKQKIKDIFVHT